ncbi:hypothetical protein [Clostridium arbusti]|uniref:hypothetical protein n=1 Tax=Clostridium arbusti TaxID=1137848 RepID=UPI00028A1D70|nr:hypothetical protein [Clostridium arbusti]
MKKMDEMEMSINLKAIKWSGTFTNIALLVWSIYNFIHTHTLTLPFYILNIEIAIYYCTTQILRWKMDDMDGRKSIIRYFIGVILVVLIVGILAHFFPK